MGRDRELNAVFRSALLISLFIGSTVSALGANQSPTARAGAPIAAAAVRKSDARVPVPSAPHRLFGTWLMDGQAELISVQPEAIVSYDITAVSCVESARNSPDQFDRRFGGSLEIRSPTVVVVRDRSGEPYTLRRLSNLPQRCRDGGTTGSDPVLNFEAFWHYFAENYANSDVRGIDWKAIYKKYRPKITHETSQEQLWNVYGSVFQEFDDVHVFLSNGKEGAAERFLSAGRPSGLRAALLRQNPDLSQKAASDLDLELLPVLNQVVLYDLLHGRFTADLQGKFEWGWAAPKVGYLYVQGMYGLFAQRTDDPHKVDEAVRHTMDRVFSDFADARALIIDIRQNRGGSDQVGRIIASYFIERPISISTRAKTPKGFTPWFSITVQPSGAPRFSRPVYLLVSDNTVSAAEDFTAIMRTCSNVTIVGTRTRGAYSSILVKKLPNGFELGISNYQTRGPRGESLEGKGIDPGVHIESYNPQRLITGYLDAPVAAVKLAQRALTTGDANRRPNASRHLLLLEAASQSEAARSHRPLRSRLH